MVVWGGGMSVLCCVRGFIWLVQPNKPDCFVISMLPQSLLPKLRYAALLFPFTKLICTFRLL